MSGRKVRALKDEDWDADDDEADESEESEGHGEDRYCFPRAHHVQHALPTWLMILRVAIIGLSMAAVSLLMIQCETYLINEKFKLAQKVIESHDPVTGVFLATLFVVGSGTIMVIVAALLVTNIYPLGAGSGIAELKAYVNGCKIDGLYNAWTAWVRPLGAILSTGAGLPIDREGPLISTGAGVGVSITRILGRRYFKRWVQLDVQGGQQEQVVLDELKYAELTRQGAVLGGAAGLATAYNAPLGGLVYMLEEVTLLLWPERSMAAAGLVVGIAAFSAKAILLLFGDAPHTLVIFSYSASKHDLSWQWLDMPGFLMVATISAFMSAVYSYGLLKVWRCRHSGLYMSSITRRNRKTVRVLEATLFTILCVTILMTSPALISQCKKLPPEELFMYRKFIRYTCPEGEYNELATLFLQGEEGAAKTLIARDTVTTSDTSSSSSTSSSSAVTAGEGSHTRLLAGGPPVGVEGDVLQYEPWVLMCALAIYMPLSICTAGLSLPMGYFVPNMLIGGLIGNAFRSWLGNIAGDSSGLAHPGTYGLIGSASMISGFTGMTIGVVVLLTEAANDIGLVAPLLLVAIYSQFLSHIFIKHAYEEQLILDKEVPYLEPECPPEIEEQGWTAGSVCDPVPPEALLKRFARVTEVKRVLESSNSAHLQHLPVVDERGWRCIGLVPRERLAAVLQADDEAQQMSHNYHTTTPLQAQSSAVRHRLESLKVDADSTLFPGIEDDLVLDFSAFVAPASGVLDLMQLADPAPIEVLEDVSLARIYQLFAKAEVHAVCVLTSRAAPMHSSILALPSFAASRLQPEGGLGLRGILERRHVATLHHRRSHDNGEEG